MANNKNQHFVPQFHLRRWSQDGRSIHVLHLASGRVIPKSSIKGQCSKAYLYGDDPKLEEAIQQLERAGAEAIRHCIETRQPPGERDTVALLTYASFQWGRTPTAGAELEAIGTEMARRVLKTPGVIDDPDALRHVDHIRVEYKHPVQNGMKMAAEVGHCLLDLEPYLVINDSPVGFVTSDVAVTFHNQWCEKAKGVGTRGFVSGGLQLFMPLSPRNALIFVDARVYKVGVRRGPNVVTFTSPADAEMLNQLQIEAAHHNIYFDGDPRTAAALAQAMDTHRAPRHLQVRSHRAVTQDRSSELIHLYHEASQLELRLPWLTVRRNAKRMPLTERLRDWRPKAMALDELIRGPRHERSGPRPRTAKTWYLEPDE